MKIYISGPITGIPDRNKGAFQKAQKEIAAIIRNDAFYHSVKIINPVELGFKLDKQFDAKGKQPAWKDYMRVCIKELCDSDFVLFLPGWRNSDGAIFERHIANRLKIPCVESIKELLNIIFRGGYEDK